MSRAARSSRLSPWIESLILSYSQEGSTAATTTTTTSSSSSSGRLKAHVIGVGHMSQSQTQGSESPTGLLFLSDEVLQIPAILTASAWEHLQEQEDRECFTSLLNTTVCIQDYRLQFHMAHEQTRCRFFLSVGELATTAAGPVKDSTPCCTTLPSIRTKICKTWRLLLGQEAQESQTSQCGFDLSELLGEWQHDCLQAVLEDVRERLMMVKSCPVSPQPSTSTHTSSLTHPDPDTSTTTSWDNDRVRYKGVKCFSVPVKCLLIPEEDAQPNVGCRTPSGPSAASEDRGRDLPQVCQPSEITQPSVDDAEWRIARPAVAETDRNANEKSPLPLEDSMLDDDMFAEMMDSNIRPVSNPWDMFPPPETLSSSGASPEATPTHSLNNPAAAESNPEHAAILTSTQLPIHSSDEFQQTSEHSKGEHSYLPPYQKPPHSSSLPTTSGSSTSSSFRPLEPSTRPSNLSPATNVHHTDRSQQNLPAVDQESQIFEKDMEETVERKLRKEKRKRSESTPEPPGLPLEGEEEEEAQISGSPPSWLFDSQTGSRSTEDSSHQQCQTAGTVLRKTPTAHCDGRPFSYSYRVSGQNLQDFSQFKVSESWLHWAVKYLVVPKQTDNPHNMSVNSNQMSSDRAEIT